jgi:glutathione S-transferase
VTVRLFGHWTCPFVNRVDFALAQRGIRHELVTVPPSAVRPAGFVLPEDFVAHSPRLEVPLVEVDGEYRADSIPILHWLEDRVPVPPLRPPDRAGLVTERVTRLDQLLMGPMGGVAYGTEAEKIATAAARLEAAFAEMAVWLTDGGWLAGPGPTLAEALAVPVYLRLDSLVALGFDRPVPAAVEAHREATLSLPGGRHVAWDDDQRAEYLGRHRAFRRRRRRERDTAQGSTTSTSEADRPNTSGV